MAITILFAVLIIAGFLLGIRLMQSPRTALWGNRLGALAMLAAILWTFLITGQENFLSVMIYMVIGAIIGLAIGQAVKMIHMPQTVALFNGLGGAASAMVAVAAVMAAGSIDTNLLFWSTSGLAMGIGTITFSGSMIAVFKLQGLAFRKPFQIKGHGRLLQITIIAVVALILINTAFRGEYFSHIMGFIILLGLMAGFLMTLRIGGADMPIVISLLNSLSGIAAAVTGIAVENIILTGTGTLVGLAGLILTRIMCRAMNRSLLSVLTGFTPESYAKNIAQAGDKHSVVMDSGLEADNPPEVTGAKSKQKDEAESVNTSSAKAESKVALPDILNEAKRVIIVPGYGMAVAQAQTSVRRLVDALEQQEKEVKFAIHPVAGRMPGHMNVLLAEAGIDYEKMLDLEEANSQFTYADLVIVVGACDVINPAANAAEDTPISGMPILDVESSKHIIICNLDDKPGYSGVDNPLYKKADVITIWGNAGGTIPKLIEMVSQNISETNKQS